MSNRLVAWCINPWPATFVVFASTPGAPTAEALERARRRLDWYLSGEPMRAPAYDPAITDRVADGDILTIEEY